MAPRRSSICGWLTTALTDPVAKAIAAGALGRSLMFINEPEAAAELARKAAAAVPAGGGGPPRRARGVRARDALVHGPPDPGVFDRLEEHRKPPAADAPVGEKMLAAVAAADWAWRGGSADEYPSWRWPRCRAATSCGPTTHCSRSPRSGRS